MAEQQAAALTNENHSTEERETCVCAAVLANGVLFTGRRHGECIGTAIKSGCGRVSHDQQGFVTTAGRFVDREEGMKLQRAAGIASVAPGGYRDNLLFSEDLY